MKVTEAKFTAQVIELARLCGWRTLHLRPARTSKGWRTPVQGDGVGWPDLFLVRGPRIVVAELKVGGKLTTEQETWLLALGGAGLAVHVWRPKDWSSIERILQREDKK